MQAGSPPCAVGHPSGARGHVLVEHDQATKAGKEPRVRSVYRREKGTRAPHRAVGAPELVVSVEPLAEHCPFPDPDQTRPREPGEKLLPGRARDEEADSPLRVR